MITIFTDGASKGNPGSGGYGTILKYGKKEKELSGGFRKTTNNRMELMAVIVGLESIIKPGWDVSIVSDSKYVVDAISKGWLERWAKERFKGKKNKDLWERYLEAASNHNVKCEWVKGHAGHPENIRCDQLAVNATKSENLGIDMGYEKGTDVV